MDTSSYDAKIRDAEKTKQEALDQLEMAAQTYIREAAHFFKVRFPEMMQSAITKYPEVVERLGLEKLRQLKTDLANTIERCDVIVADHLDKPDIWQHRASLPGELEDVGAYRPGVMSSEARALCRAAASPEEGLREVMGYVGHLLVKNGLAKAGKDDEWQTRADALPRYRYGITTNKEMDEARKRYNSLFESYVTAHIQIGVLQREKRQAMAKDLWDQA